MSDQGYQHWSTEDEIDFLRDIGRFRFSSSYVPKGYRLSLLKRYKSAMKYRVNWDRINPDIIKEIVGTYITQEEYVR